MRYPLSMPSLLVLGTFGLAACGIDTATEPTQVSEPGRTVPELAVAPGSWITRANMPANRVDLAAATVTNAAGQSIVYAIGGRRPGGEVVNLVTAYNAATNTWSFRRPLPRPLYSSNGAGVINGKIYVSGGFANSGGIGIPSSSLLMYNPVTDTWTEKRAMPGAGGEGITGVIKGELYVVNACEQNFWSEGCASPSALYRYNPGTDRWITLASPPPDDDVAVGMGGVLNGKLYLMSRFGWEGRLRVYDPATNRWTAKTPLPRARWGAATAVLNGKLYVMGGVRPDSVTYQRETLRETIVYDPATDAWTVRATLPARRSGIAGSKVFVNGQPRIEVVGGVVPNNNVQYVP